MSKSGFLTDHDLRIINARFYSRLLFGVFMTFRPQTFALLGVLVCLLISLSAQADGDFPYCTGERVYQSSGGNCSLNNFAVCGGCTALEACQKADPSTATATGTSGSCIRDGGTAVRSFNSWPNPCGEGQALDMSLNWLNPGACVEYDPPPPTPTECVASHGPGWLPLPINVGDETFVECTYIFTDNNEDCSSVLGTVTYNGEEKIVCADDYAQCQNEGGFWGTWGLAGNEVEGCLSPEVYDPITCSGPGAFYADEATSSFVCESPLDAYNDDQPNINDPNDIDTDGDGSPDKNDSDIDGDGISNSQDPDRDGDGTSNEDDLTPDGEEEEVSSVDGGGKCDVAPRCTGDAIQCSILYQLWKSRCDALNNANDDVISESDLLLGNEPGQLYSGTDLTSDISGFLSQSGLAGSCPQPKTLVLMGTTVDVPFTAFCDFASLVRPFVIFLFGYIGFRIVMRAF